MAVFNTHEKVCSGQRRLMEIKSLIIYSFLHIDFYCFTLNINIIPKYLRQNFPSLSDAVVKCNHIPAVLIAVIN